jgi:hypothetical protein
MNTTSLLQLCGAAACLSLASCALWPYPNSHDAAKRDGEGYSLDNPASGSRYMANADNAASSSHTETTTTTGPSSTVETTTTTTTEPAAKPAPAPAPAPTVTAPAPPTTAAPTYGTPVPGRRGFVYPPGVDTKPENMVDVRDFQPGQKVRDPRTGKIFLVP